MTPQVQQVQEFVAGQAAVLADRARNVRRNLLSSARDAVRISADSIRSLKSPMRTFARSGIHLTSVSHTFSQNLIELQTDIFSAAITDAARRLERASRAASLAELVRDQIELVPATRARIDSDTQRVAQILRAAGREVRAVATQTYQEIRSPERSAAPAAKRKTRKSTERKSTARKSTARKSTARKSTARKSTARKSTARARKAA
jgi:hypothetical protein